MCRGICFCFFFCISLLICNAQSNSEGKGNFSITLFLKNPTGRQIIADIEPITLAKASHRTQRKILFDDNNKGVLRTFIKGPSVLKLMNAYADSTISFVALPGVNMVVHLDTRAEDTTHYRDIGPGETLFYLGITEKSRELLSAIPQNSPEEFIKRWETGLDAIQGSVKSAKAAGIPQGYATWISQSIQSLFQTTLSRQLVNYATIKRVWPVNIKDYINKVPAFTDKQLNQPSFFTRETDKELMESYYLFHSLISHYERGLPAPGVEENYRSAISDANKIRAEASRNIMLRYLVTSLTAHTTDTASLRWMKSVVVFGTGNEHLRKMVEEKQALLRALGSNKPAPYFEATDVAGTKFSYSNYQGKYLFIDIWATWCVPCRKEIPHLEQLKQKYAGAPIEFVSVSIDKNTGAWKAFVEASDTKNQFQSMPGDNFCVSEVYKAPLIPTFILIDPQGKIINPNAFRPSDPALTFMLDQFIKKQ